MPEGAVALSAIVGFGENGFLGIAPGLELRAAYQASADMELGVGVGVAVTDGVPKRSPNYPDPPDIDNPQTSMNVFGGALRVYTSITPAGEHVAFTTGLGFVVLNTGLVALTLDGGVTFGYPDDTATPYGGAFVALSKPLRRGIEFGSSPEYPKTGLYVGGSFGVGLPEGAHFLSFEMAYAKDLFSGASRDHVFGLAVGERYVAD